jgi:hypothetical protein
VDQQRQVFFEWRAIGQRESVRAATQVLKPYLEEQARSSDRRPAELAF